MDSRRFILVGALALVLMLLWRDWQIRHSPVTPPTETAAENSAPQTVPSAPMPAQQQEVPAAAPEKPAQTLKRGRQVEVITDVYRAVIDSQGGDLRALYLLKHSVDVKQPDQPFPLLLEEEQQLYVAQSGLIGKDRQYPTHETRYRVSADRYALAEDQDKLEVTLLWTAPDRVRYKKIYTFYRNRYLIDVRYEIENLSTTEWQGFDYGQFRRSYVKQSKGLTKLPIYVGGAIYTPTEHFEKIKFSDMEEAPLKRDTKGGWVAMLQHYFVGAWLPGQEAENRFYSKVLPNANYIIGYVSRKPEIIAPGGKGELHSQLYVGPKEHVRLKKLPTGMELTVDFGWLTVISAPLFWLLVEIHRWVGNWGWAIIILTLIIKLVFFPLSATSYKSMANLRRLQPKLQSLKDRYGDDKQRLNQAMMELYKTEKINPLGGCLPILIQIPVFIALYWVLLESVEMRQAPFALWIQDLSSPDPYFVLPIIMGISMFLQHQLNPSPMDPMQKKIFQIMPVMFTVFFLFFPAGLVLYWVVNNILSIAQQWQITRMIEGKG